MENNRINNFQDLKVWQKSHNFVLQIYNLTNSFKIDEKYRLTDQLNRAAISIPTNIAEGMGRYSKKEFIKFLIISRGSTEECKYLLLLARDLKYIDSNLYDKFLKMLDEIGKMLNGLINSLNEKNK